MNLLSPDAPLIHMLTPSTRPRAETVIVSKNLPPVDKKLVERIWRKEYINLELLLPAKLGSPEPTLGELLTGGRKKEKKLSMSIQEWVGCFNTYIAILTEREPSRVKDLLAYSSMIVKASVDFMGECWSNYDQFFRRQAAAEPERYPRWGEIDPCMWTQHFGRAIPRPTCATCGEKGHEKCAGGVEGAAQGKKLPYARAKPYPSPCGRPPICRRWNRGDACSPSYCNYQHVCSECFKDHREKECPSKKQPEQKNEGGRHTFRP